MTAKSKQESHIRSVVKGITWRFVGTMDTMLISWFITGSFKFAASIASVEVFTKIALYYLHERAWQLLPRGTVRNLFKSKASISDSAEDRISKDLHIHPITDRMADRSVRESLLQQRGGVYWMTGLSGSGKSTIALGLEKALLDAGHYVVVLDGDNIRDGINQDLSFSIEDRHENIRRIAEIAKLFCQNGALLITSFISPTEESRAFAKSIIGEEDFHEIYINTPLEICEQRDVKGLYKKARAGEIKSFTGIDSPYEPPVNPFLEIKTQDQTVDESVQQVFDSIIRYATQIYQS